MTVTFVDVEALLVGWLTDELTDTRCATEVPADLGDVLPCVWLQRFGGADRDVSLDDARVDISAFAATRTAAKVLAEQVRTALKFTLPGQVVGTAVVTRVTTISGPTWLPWDNTSVRRFGASYQITTQSREVSP